jgi:hypothetical protein
VDAGLMTKREWKVKTKGSIAKAIAEAAAQAVASQRIVGHSTRYSIVATAPQLE